MLPDICLKPKTRRRFFDRPGYQQCFLAKQERNKAAARLRMRARREAWWAKQEGDDE
jgi:hypothetical protein